MSSIPTYTGVQYLSEGDKEGFTEIWLIKIGGGIPAVRVFEAGPWDTPVGTRGLQVKPLHVSVDDPSDPATIREAKRRLGLDDATGGD